MNDEAGTNDSALQAWASTVMAGDESAGDRKVGDFDRAPGQAHYEPEDVISVFMSARESAKQRQAQAAVEPQPE